jgi:hypothetical protein
MLMHQQNLVCFDLRRSHSQLLQHVATVVEKHVTTTLGAQDEDKQNKKHNTICVGHHYAQASTNNVNKT